MPMWRCPHCGTPQAEAARCWVCRRSSTSCGTCRHFRRAVAANLGYCGLDRARRPLAGDELRGCWAASTDVAADPTPPARRLPVARSSESRLDFVEIGATRDSTPDAARTRRRTERSTADASEAAPSTPLASREPGWSLWGDLDP